MQYVGFNWYLFYMGSACSIGGLVAIYYESGTEGIRRVFGRIKLSRSPMVWFLAFVMPPLWVFGSALLYGVLFDPQGLEGVQPANLIQFFSLHTFWLFTTGPLEEEFGWRGYYLPKLLKTNSFMVANLILGFVWALWHLPLMLPKWMGDPLSALSFFVGVTFFAFWLSTMYVKSNANILYCMMIHWVINASQEHSFLGPIFPKMDLNSPMFSAMYLCVGALVTILLLWWVRPQEPALLRRVAEEQAD